jgi:hypothetical protein
LIVPRLSANHHRKSQPAPKDAAFDQRYSFEPEMRKALALWAEHVTRCAGNIIIARPVEYLSDFSEGLGEKVSDFSDTLGELEAA